MTEDRKENSDSGNESEAGKKREDGGPMENGPMENGPMGKGPMEMGMSMARKMMGQTGKGGPRPMAMMQKMMAQMAKGQEDGQPMPPMMQMCMGMCSEMLTAIKQTTDMAAFATPELQGLFAAWLETLEQEALQCLERNGGMDAPRLAKALHIDEKSAAYLFAHMAAAGKLTLQARPSGKESAET